MIGMTSDRTAHRLMRIGDYRAVSREIQAGADTLYEMLSDVTRIGEWSPECRAAQWLDGAVTAGVGVRFRGRNRSGLANWSRTCEIVEATPGRVFAFRTVPGRLTPDSTLWRYTLSPNAEGTLVTESYEILQPLPEPIQHLVVRPLLSHHFDMRPDMVRTLERLDAGVRAARGSGTGGE